jgi:hypothetical protein
VTPDEPIWEIVRGLRIVAAPVDAQPFPVDAVADEEDTFLVLSAEAVLHAPADHPIRVLHDAFAAEPAELGSVVVREDTPLRLLAVVHDLDQDPTWRVEWVAAALAAVLRETENRGLRSLALPLIGTRHGRLDPERCVDLLRDALDATPPSVLQRLWLVVPADTPADVFMPLERPPGG